jgi:aldehyde dehydrogenase (NAD+)
VIASPVPQGAKRWLLAEHFDVPEVFGTFVGGKWAFADGAEVIEVEDPATLEPIAKLAEADDDLVDQAVSAADRAYRDVWSRVEPRVRSRVLAAIAAEIRRRADDLSHLESLDTGKPLSQARSDIEGAARYFEYYSGVADKIRGSNLPQAADTLAYTRLEPYGVIAHITPWNSPFSQMCRGVAPSLAAGNSVVLKPSEVAPLSCLLAGSLFTDAGLPVDVCTVLPGRGGVGQALVSHPAVRRVSFTGSVATGQRIMHYAADRVIGCNLELGGKSPLLVLEDADLGAAARAGAMAVSRNAGQSCFAATRLLVQSRVYDELVERLCAEVEQFSVGHGLDDPDLGPLANHAQLEKVLAYVAGARAQGAEVGVGGGRPEIDLPGHFVQPTVLVDVTNDMQVAREEVFGPVQSVIRVEDDDDAIAQANDSDYGLAAGIFTQSLSRAHRIAHLLEAGQVQVNRYPAGGVDTPFGGYKQSGIGREKGVEALEHYTQLKTVIVAL